MITLIAVVIIWTLDERGCNATPMNMTCNVTENVQTGNVPVCSVRDELLRRNVIDGSMKLRYELIAQSDPIPFELNTASGLITTTRNGELDRERVAHFDLVVVVDNARSGASTSKLPNSVVVNVRVTVLDENDNAPVWTNAAIRSNFRRRIAGMRPGGSSWRVIAMWA